MAKNLNFQIQSEFPDTPNCGVYFRSGELVEDMECLVTSTNKNFEWLVLNRAGQIRFFKAEQIV